MTEKHYASWQINKLPYVILFSAQVKKLYALKKNIKKIIKSLSFQLRVDYSLMLSSIWTTHKKTCRNHLQFTLQIKRRRWHLNAEVNVHTASFHTLKRLISTYLSCFVLRLVSRSTVSMYREELMARAIGGPWVWSCNRDWEGERFGKSNCCVGRITGHPGL